MGMPVEVQPISDTFASEAPEIEVMGDFVRLTFWSDQEVDGQMFKVIVSRIILPIEAMLAFVRKPSAEVVPFRPRLVS